MALTSPKRTPLCRAFQGKLAAPWYHGEGVCVAHTAEEIILHSYPHFVPQSNSRTLRFVPRLGIFGTFDTV